MNRSVFSRLWVVLAIPPAHLRLAPRRMRTGVLIAMTGVGILLTLTLVTGEPPSSIRAASVPRAVVRATTTVTPAYLSEPWTRLGGPPGGIGYDIRMVPDNPDIMYVTDDGGGIFKSTNGGQSWFPINNGIEPSPGAGAPIFCATIDPHDYNTIWVGTRGIARIYRSTDGGENWEERSSGIIPITDEHAVRGITVDPNNANIVYAALEEGIGTVEGVHRTRGEIYKSIDAGLNWTRIWHGNNLARYVWIDPTNTQRLYCSTGIFDRNAANSDEDGKGGGVGILRSDDAGQTWTELNKANGLGGLFIPSLFMHPEDPNILLAAVTSARGDSTDVPGIYVTRNGGDTWQLAWRSPSAEAVEIATGDPDVWYGAMVDGIFRSDDGGQNWQEFVLRTAHRGSGFPIDLQADPRDPYRIFVNSYGGGNMLSTNGGETWVDASAGYTGAGVWGVFVSPEDSRTVLAGANTATFRSVNGGLNWQGTVIDGPAARIVSYPEADGSGTHILASGPFNTGVVYHSTDSGLTWEAAEVADLDPTQQTDVLFVARALAVAPSDPQTVYTGYAQRPCLLFSWQECWFRPPGFFRSQDGGDTWEQVQGLPFAEASILTIAVSPTDRLTLYAATMKGLYLTQDGGDTWQHLQALESVAPKYPGLPVAFVVATDPFDSQVIYVGSPRGGVYRSEDGGATWEQASSGMDPNEEIDDILPDPDRSGVLYASARYSGVFVSTDGAQSWQRLDDGFPQVWAGQLALSDDGSVLYAATRGAGVFQLGAPQQVGPTPTATLTSPPSTPSPTPTPTLTSPPSTPSPTPTTTASPTGVPCENTLPHGDFEAGLVRPWVGQGGTQVTTARAHGGSSSVLLGGANGAAHELFASVDLPSDATSSTLSYWWYVDTTETAPDADRLTVLVTGPDGEVVLELLTNDSPPSAWHRSDFDLGAHMGQSVTLTFFAHTDDANVTSFFVDDVEIEVCRPVEASHSVYLPVILR